MKLEERSIGMALTPEIKALVRTVFERAFDRVEGQVDHVRVRLMPAHDGVECRARLWPLAGATLVVSETGPSTIDAVLATASNLAQTLQRRLAVRDRRPRRGERHHGGGALVNAQPTSRREGAATVS